MAQRRQARSITCVLPQLHYRLYSRTTQQGECLVWTGRRTYNGYGTICYSGRRLRCHRLSWTLAYGEIPDGLFVLHSCDNPPCIRPEHLFLGTAIDNVTDMMQKGRQARGDKHRSRTHPETLSRGEANGRAKLKTKQAVAIKTAYAQGEATYNQLARLHGITYNCVWDIVHGKTWTHL